MAVSKHMGEFYIDGRWVKPSAGATSMGVENPATEEIVAEVALGSEEDADRAILAARAAFDGFTNTPVAERIALLKRVHEIYLSRAEEFAEAISTEMGAPMDFARSAQFWAGDVHIGATIKAGEEFEWEHQRGTTRVVHEGIGIAGMITPWNWPMNQIACKVAPAIVAGCTMVLKPSEIAPLSGTLFAEVMEAAGTPKGVFNLVNGMGPTVGARLSSHPQVDMVSFTGSTRAGIQVATNAAPTVKRVAQELGGKSANIILDDADLERAIPPGVQFGCYLNSGQTCSALTRMLVPRQLQDRVVELAVAKAESLKVGPADSGADLGPLISANQRDRVRGYIQQGIDEGARLVTGGPEAPEGLDTGYFVQPTIFADVTPDMTIAQEEIFGPVLCILPYDSEDEAVEIANSTVYGLAGGVQSGDQERALAVARRLRTGQVEVNGGAYNIEAPFGGYKQSGNGRELGPFGLEEFCEVKAIQLPA